MVKENITHEYVWEKLWAGLMSFGHAAPLQQRIADVWVSQWSRLQPSDFPDAGLRESFEKLEARVTRAGTTSFSEACARFSETEAEGIAQEHFSILFAYASWHAEQRRSA